MSGTLSTLTAFVLAAFVGYGGAWYLGYIEGGKLLRTLKRRTSSARPS